MTVLPGALDYLYYNGILDHIPYEAYEMTPPANNAMNATQYMNMAQAGNLYNNYANDMFVAGNNANYSVNDHAYGNGMGYGKENYNIMTNGEEGKSFRQAITDEAENATNKVSNKSTLMKGLLALGAIGATTFCLIKGFRKPSASGKPSFWSKLNPFNWFKK